MIRLPMTWDVQEVGCFILTFVWVLKGSSNIIKQQRRWQQLHHISSLQETIIYWLCASSILLLLIECYLLKQKNELAVDQKGCPGGKEELADLLSS
jgi:hypothetical protein